VPREASPPASATDDRQSGATRAAEASADAPASADAQPAREIRYVVTPDGLEIRIEGTRFIANAEAEHVKGGFGVQVQVKASVTDDNSHSLLRPKHGPLAFAGVVERGGRRDRFNDERNGSEEQVLSPRAALTFTRNWPGKGGPAPLSDGQSLELEVGLWGIGNQAAERRPVRNFFNVKVSIEHGKARVSVNPPASAKD
jgi:hypothetical protein